MPAAHVSSSRARLGVVLWVVSYLPFPVIIAGILHDRGQLSSAKSTSVFLAVTWTIQIVIGLVGLAMAGQAVITLLKRQGLKRLPVNFWYVLRGREIKDMHQ